MPSLDDVKRYLADETGLAIGPDDAADGIDAEALRLLLREIFAAAGGTHDDLDEYDRAMVEGARTAILVSPDRIIGNVR